jgi:superfamily II DNA or RNA helicase
VIVFSESIESIEELKKYLIENGVSAETYHSQKPESVRDSIFAEWGRGIQSITSNKGPRRGGGCARGKDRDNNSFWKGG